MPAAFLNISPQGLSLTGSSLIQLDWTATEPQGSLFAPSSVLGQ